MKLRKLQRGAPGSEFVAHYEQMVDMVNELYEQMGCERKMREEYPALQKAWDHYQFTKQMVTEKN